MCTHVFVKRVFSSGGETAIDRRTRSAAACDVLVQRVYVRPDIDSRRKHHVKTWSRRYESAGCTYTYKQYIGTKAFRCEEA